VLTIANEYEDKNVEANEYGNKNVEMKKKPRRSKSPKLYSKCCIKISWMLPYTTHYNI